MNEYTYYVQYELHDGTVKETEPSEWFGKTLEKQRQIFSQCEVATASLIRVGPKGETIIKTMTKKFSKKK